MRVVTHVFVAFTTLLLLGVLWPRLAPALGAILDVIGVDSGRRAVPDFVALWALYLGLTTRVRLVPAIAGAVVIGYLADLLMGTPHGLLALTAGIVCMAGHLIQGRLLVRGRLYTSVLSFLTAMIAGLVVFAISGIWGVQMAGVAQELGVLVTSALLTAAIGPLVFRVCRRVDARFLSGSREQTMGSRFFEGPGF